MSWMLIYNARDTLKRPKKRRKKSKLQKKLNKLNQQYRPRKQKGEVLNFPEHTYRSKPVSVQEVKDQEARKQSLLEE